MKDISLADKAYLLNMFPKSKKDLFTKLSEGIPINQPRI